MASSEPVTRPERPRRFDQRLQAHKEEVTRLREQFGDPQEALFFFIRDKFELQSFFPGPRKRSRRRLDWDDDDNLDAW